MADTGSNFSIRKKFQYGETRRGREKGGGGGGGTSGLISNQDSAGSERCSWAFAMKINQAGVGPPAVFPDGSPSLLFSLTLPLSLFHINKTRASSRIIIRLTELWLIDTYRSFTIMGQLKISALVGCLRRANRRLHSRLAYVVCATPRCRICENSGTVWSHLRCKIIR